MPSTDAEIVAELERLLLIAKRDVSRELLQGELDIVKARMAESQNGAAPEPAPAPAPALPPAPQPAVPAPIRVAPAAPAIAAKPFVSFPRYSWDQSSKWVKVYLTVDRISDVPDEQISASFESDALCLEITMLPQPPPNRRLAISLGGSVDPEQCKWVRKPPDMLLVKMRKATDGHEWKSLDDSISKKEREKEARLEENKHKSTAELLSQMYSEADEDGKAALSKAWEDGREKREEKRQPV